MIRLEHMASGKNLHSHGEHKGPISRKNEVSGFGDDGEGDQADNWLVECLDTYGLVKPVGEIIYGNTILQFRHS